MDLFRKNKKTNNNINKKDSKNNNSKENTENPLPTSQLSLENPQTISILDKRFNIKTDGTDVTVTFKKALNYAVTNGLKVLVPKSNYTVAGLDLPSNLNIHFAEGSKMILTPNSPADTRCIRISRVNNIRITGLLEIDGNKDTIKNGSEHMHGLFIYNVRDITIDNVYSHDCYGDNVSISGGSDNPGDFSENVTINNLKALRAGRKNLVIEHVDNLNIPFADLDNSTGGVDGNGGNCLDVEPFEYSGTKKKFTINLGNVKTRGAGNDFSAGTTLKEAQGFVVNIDNMECSILDLKTNDILNASRWKSAIYSYAITLNIKKLVIHLASTRTALSKGKYTEPTSALYIQHGATINIDDMKVYGGCDNSPVIRLELGYAQPTITINKLLLDCPLSYGIKNERANMFIGNLEVKSLKDQVLYCDTMSNNAIKIDSLNVKNSCLNNIIYLSSGTTITSARVIIENAIIIDTRTIKVKNFLRLENKTIMNTIKLGNITLPIQTNRITLNR